MTRTATHATFVVERDIAAPVEKVWAAFADPEIKAQWFKGDGFTSNVDISEDFRIGGHGVNDADMAEGVRSRFLSTYTDIVEHERIIYTYDMWLNETHASTSLATITFQASERGTLLTVTEQGVYLDGVHGPGMDAANGREHGTNELIDKMITVVLAK
jgi:uncharacterized protein YndB with AHSA1/START domain